MTGSNDPNLVAIGVTLHALANAICLFGLIAILVPIGIVIHQLWNER